MPKKIIVCADGTWNTESQTDEGYPSSTNVVKIARALLPTDSKGVQQLVHYERGVGTNIGFRVRGGALGRGLFQNVVDCYRFLCHNYEPGDRLYLFGFSRGAYTARSLAGLVRNSGILKRGEESAEREAIDLYRDYAPDTAPEGPVSIKFREAHSHSPEIEFIGVWDTVGALGIPNLDGSFRVLKGLDWQFHDVTLSSKTTNAFHALAIHEHRAEFVPTLWELPADAPKDQRLEQTWFAGVHSDVGGGYPATGLSDVAMEWMVEKAEQFGGLVFDHKTLALHPDPTANGHDSFGAFYKVLDWMERKKGGFVREFSAGGAKTNETIHPRVFERFGKLPNEKWPPTFDTALKAGPG